MPLPGREIGMHDIRTIRDDRAGFVRGLTRRGISDADAIAAGLAEKDRALRDLLTRLQTSQARRNEASKSIGQAKARKDETLAAVLMEEVAGLKQAIQEGEAQQRQMEEAWGAVIRERQRDHGVIQEGSSRRRLAARCRRRVLWK